MSNTLIQDRTTGNPIRQLLIFSLPFMASNLLQQGYSLADTIIVGRFLGSAGLTAASNASNINMLFLLLCVGFSSAGQIVVSQLVGAGNRKRLQSVIGTLFTVNLILGVTFLIIPLLLGPQLLRLINIPEEAFAGGLEYIRVCAFGNLVMAMYNCVSSILRGMGDSKHPMIFVIIASLLNIVLDLLFVGPMGMGCFGAALATVISQAISCILCFGFTYRHRDEFSFEYKLSSFRIDPAEFPPLLKLGIPMMIQSLSVTVSMMFITARVNNYGLTAAAVAAVGSKINMFSSIGSHAFNAAGSTLIGQNFAAGKHKRITSTLGAILLIGCAFAAVIAFLIVLFPEQIFGIFNPDPAVLELCHTYVPISVIDVFGFATRAAAFAFINGIGFAALSFVGGILDGVVCRIGFALFFELGLGMGLYGLWLGSVLAGHVFLFVGGFYFLSGRWKTRKTLIE
ncbi:MAG: MATE family efflux transporter [Oscillospiraceae bacterium]|nr:MATE family efflux transporter [Oscillospiraceae bacterium]